MDPVSGVTAGVSSTGSMPGPTPDSGVAVASTGGVYAGGDSGLGGTVGLGSRGSTGVAVGTGDGVPPGVGLGAGEGLGDGDGDLVDSVYRELADYFNKYGIQCGLCSCSVGSEESLVEHISGYIREHDVSLVLLGSRLFQLINGRLPVPLVEIRRSFYDFYVSIKKATRKNF